MKGAPTERRAALAARQLYYHRNRLLWLRDRMHDNEALLLSYLTLLEAGAAFLPGGYRISGGCVSPAGGVLVEKLTPKSPYEQLVLGVGERRIA